MPGPLNYVALYRATRLNIPPGAQLVWPEEGASADSPGYRGHSGIAGPR